MSAFGGPLERTAKLLFDARMNDCWGNWQSEHRFEWPSDREGWQHYQHNPHPQIEIALAQARAVMPFMRETPE